MTLTSPRAISGTTAQTPTQAGSNAAPSLLNTIQAGLAEPASQSLTRRLFEGKGLALRGSHHADGTPI
jgi:hypothetical protein